MDRAAVVLDPRTRICLRCRVALLAGEPCDGDPAHPVVELASIEGREQLVSAVWGPLVTRHAQLRATARTERVAAAVGLGGMVVGIGAMELVMPGLSPVHALAGGVAMLASWASTRVLVRRVEDPYPIGGTPRPVIHTGSGPRGAASGACALTSPATATDCLAFCFELRHIGPHGNQLIYRDAVTSGFDVAIDAGGTARIPAGRIHIVAAARQVIDFDNRTVERYLCDIDRHHSLDASFDPLHYNVIYEQLVLPDDRVELVSGFEPVVESGAGETGYREPAPSHLAPCGVAAVRLL